LYTKKILNFYSKKKKLLEKPKKSEFEIGVPVRADRDRSVKKKKSAQVEKGHSAVICSHMTEI